MFPGLFSYRVEEDIAGFIHKVHDTTIANMILQFVTCICNMLGGPDVPGITVSVEKMNT